MSFITEPKYTKNLRVLPTHLNFIKMEDHQYYEQRQPAIEFEIY